MSQQISVFVDSVQNIPKKQWQIGDKSLFKYMLLYTLTSCTTRPPFQHSSVHYIHSFIREIIVSLVRPFVRSFVFFAFILSFVFGRSFFLFDRSSVHLTAAWIHRQTTQNIGVLITISLLEHWKDGATFRPKIVKNVRNWSMKVTAVVRMLHPSLVCGRSLLPRYFFRTKPLCLCRIDQI